MPFPADANLALSTILGFPPVIPSEGGWDGVLNDHIDESIIDLREGLLARLINLAPGNTGGGSVLVTVPTGFSAMINYVHVVRRGSTPSASNSYDLGSENTAPQNWNDGVGNFNRLSDDTARLILVPRVAGVNLEGDSPIAPFTINGDDSNNDFRIIRTAGSSIALDWWVFGYAWRNP